VRPRSWRPRRAKASGIRWWAATTYTVHRPDDPAAGRHRRLGFTLRIDVFLDNPACADRGGSGSVMPNLVHPFADAQHRPSITTAVLAPLRVLAFGARFIGGDPPFVIVRAVVQSVWGNYDVDEGNLSATLDGPTGHVDLEPVAMLQRLDEHGHHGDPVDAQWEFQPRGMPSACTGST